MKSILIFLTLVSIFFRAQAAEAKDYTGFKKKDDGVTRSIEGNIVRYIETESELKILFNNYAAFYRFPKNTEVKAVLDQSIKNKKPVQVTVDAFSREIISLSSSNK